jgi:glycosyltransferase involved in cell wall biosynthesis
MKTVGIITTRLTTDHQVRGIGNYIQILKSAILSSSRRSQFLVQEIKDISQLNSSNVNIIHYPFFELFSRSLIIPNKAKTLVTIHDVIPLEYPNHYRAGLRGSWNLHFQKKSLTKVDKIVTDSSASASNIVKQLQIPHEKVNVVYLAAKEIFRQINQHNIKKSIKEKYKLPDKFVLYVGDINYNKNLPTLIHACKQLDITLVLVGKSFLEVDILDINHPELSHLKNINWHDIYRLGFVPEEDLSVIYNLATVYCQPSFSEGFGLPVLEAMSCGTPVVCSKTSSLPEVAGVAGLYFNPYDDSELIQQIKKIFQSEKTRKSLSKLSIEQSAKFSVKKMGLEMIKIYQDLI